MSIVKINDKYKIMNITNSYDKLPVGVYTLSFNEVDGSFELDEQPQFNLPNKVYGNHDIIYRWLKSYRNNSEKNMGIILSGIKGGGKTITAQKFCIESGLPVIIINSAFEGAAFTNFLVNPKLGQCIILIDEFEKVYNTDNYYDRTKASDLLTLMDGTYNTKLIFLLTVNTYNLGDFFINRLGRIKYRKDFGGLESDIIESVIDDMLINKSHKQSIYDFFEIVNMCTFDLLTNLIKEMNLFNEDALEAGKHLNLRPEPKKYSVSEVVGDKEYKCSPISLIPGDKQINISRYDIYYLPKNDDDDDDENYQFKLKISDFELIKIDNTSFILKNDKYKFKFTEENNYSLIF